MKMTICGSSVFRKEMVDYKEKLERLGHKVIMHPHYIQSVKGKRKDIISRMNNGEHAEVKKENNYIKWHYGAIKKSDAVLVLNLDKKGVKNYIGGNTLMEMGFAHVLNKKIFLLNSIPKMNYTDEIKAMTEVVLEGDLSKIK